MRLPGTLGLTRMGMADGPLWQRLNKQPRHLAVELRMMDIPAGPGIYAWYRDGGAIYVGKADSLRSRLWRNHLGKGRVMTGSAFRRNVAEHLGISPASQIKSRHYQPDDDEVSRIRAFIESCEVAWMTASTPAAALALEKQAKAEWMPPLTKK